MAPPHPLTRRARAALRTWLPTLPPSLRIALRRTEWRDQPLTLIGAPVDPELASEHELWTRQLGEYINAHEEVGFFLQERRFHICRAHPAARDVISTGVIPADFTCPRRVTTCPFAGAAAVIPGQAVKLLPVVPSRAAASRTGTAGDLSAAGRAPRRSSDAARTCDRGRPSSRPS